MKTMLYLMPIQPIGTIVIGYNPTIQKNGNLGKTNNQNFVNIPIGSININCEHLLSA
jgi:putative transposase